MSSSDASSHLIVARDEHACLHRKQIARRQSQFRHYSPCRLAVCVYVCMCVHACAREISSRVCNIDDQGGHHLQDIGTCRPCAACHCSPKWGSQGYCRRRECKKAGWPELAWHGRQCGLWTVEYGVSWQPQCRKLANTSVCTQEQ